MNLKFVQRRCGWVSPASAALIALLQRTPILRGVAAAGEYVSSPPAGTLLRSAALAAASLGAVDSMAGATLLATSLDPVPTGNLPPFNATVGVPITPLAFTIANLITIGSWKVVGEIPPGLTLTTVQPNGGILTGFGGNLDATTVTNGLTTPILEGTPTVAGTYTITMQGFWMGGESGGPYMGKGVSSVFPFTIVVGSTVPVFTTQPISVAVTGGTVALDAVAAGAGSYQWMLNGSPMPGATRPTLLLSDAAASAGTYTCVATNSLGSTTSNPATVSIIQTNDIGRLINISTRSQVGTGANVLIVGFNVGGIGTTGSESLLIRGSGPALSAFGVPGVLADPQLKLFTGSGALLGSNDGWAGSAAISLAADSVGAFPWSIPTSKDSAFLNTLAPGGYTAQIAGESGDSGVALARVYDATPAGTYTPTTPRITNISARVPVGTGGNILIAGFAIGGSTSRTVLIRASGPGIVQFGVPGTLPDPLLRIYSGSTLLASNAVWSGDPQISNTAASVGAFTWLVPTSNDSAILETLPPGAYTAQVSGVLNGLRASLSSKSMTWMPSRFPSFSPERRPVAGSIREARRAGMYPAPTAQAKRPMTAATLVITSFGEMP